MHIIARCPRCGYRSWLDATAADRRLRCRKCSLLLRIPNLTEVADAADVINHAGGRVFVDDTGKVFG